MQRLLIAPASLLFALVSLSACGASNVRVDAELEKGLSEKDLEKGVTEQLTEMAGTAPDEVDGPGDLEAEVGKTMRCTLTAGPDELGVTVTVTEVEGERIDYDIEVDEM